MLSRVMDRWKRWIDRARKVAEENLPQRVVDAGRKLIDDVAEVAPTRLAEVLGRGPATTTSATMKESPRDSAHTFEDRAEILDRVRAKAEHGLKPEDRVVVIYATRAEAEAVAEIHQALAGIETTVRDMDLAKEPPQTATQLAKLTGVMVPPYVYINGRYWGAQYEMISLRASGDLESVVANRLDELSPEARRVGKLHESYSDAISVANMLERWKLGHILSVDDLDAWYEIDKSGHERFFYQGAERPVADMPAVAEAIEAGVKSQAFEAKWMLEPTIHLNE